MKRRSFLSAALAGMSITGTSAAPPKVRAGDIPTTTFGKTGVKVSVIAQGGARMDLYPDIQAAAAHVRKVYDLGITYFDCARLYWDGRSEDAYGIGLQGTNLLITNQIGAERPRSPSCLSFGLKTASSEALQRFPRFTGITARKLNISHLRRKN